MAAQTGTLAGCRVLVTRPAGQAGELARAIEARGGEPHRLPAIGIQPLGPAAGAAAAAAIARAEVVVFTSVNAVECAAGRLPDLAARLAGRSVAAIGAATAASLEAAGARVDLAPSGRFDTESLLARPELAAGRLAGRVVLIVKGEGGRQALAAELGARGARVETVDVYRRVVPPPPAGGTARPVASGQLDAVVVTSAEAVANLFRMLGPVNSERLRRLSFVTVSERVAAVARAHGVACILVAARAGDPAIVACLEGWWSDRRRG